MGRSAQPLVTMHKDLWPEYTVIDHLDIYGWEFEVEMTKVKKMGLASALQGGRITRFQMSQSGELVCLFEDGKWIIRLNEENDVACIAMNYFLTKHNRRRSKKEEKERKIL